jgi:hypothetical protein
MWLNQVYFGGELNVPGIDWGLTKHGNALA